MDSVTKVVVVGCGNMGSSHARAYNVIDGFELVGLVDRDVDRRAALAGELEVSGEFDSLTVAIEAVDPDAIAIATYPESHAELVVESLNAGCHVFVEKPLATTVEKSIKIIKLAAEKKKKVIVGYILRHHPAWAKFIGVAQTLGKPLVMRMNLNQQSKGAEWQTHKNLLRSMSPIVDCGVHYVDVMCQMTRSRPVRVQAIGANLTDEISSDMYNYGQLQVVFEDGSIGWYEAGWGPMMSEVAFFVKDVIGPKGCVSIVPPEGAAKAKSSDINSHTRTNCLRKHLSELDSEGKFKSEDCEIDTADEPDHQGLCDLEQEYFLKAIQEDMDLTEHLEDAVSSLRIVLAADESVRTGKVIDL